MPGFLCANTYRVCKTTLTSHRRDQLSISKIGLPFEATVKGRLLGE